MLKVKIKTKTEVHLTSKDSNICLKPLNSESWTEALKLVGKTSGDLVAGTHRSQQLGRQHR